MRSSKKKKGKTRRSRNPRSRSFPSKIRRKPHHNVGFRGQSTDVFEVEEHLIRFEGLTREEINTIMMSNDVETLRETLRTLRVEVVRDDNVKVFKRITN